jgi:hypothetical protein
MSTQYRLVVHCDERRGKDCEGLLQFSTPFLHRMAGHSEVTARGWLRGYKVDNTYDVCPSCRKLLKLEELPEGTREIVLDG